MFSRSLLVAAVIALAGIALFADPVAACDCAIIAPPGTPLLKNGDPIPSILEIKRAGEIVFLGEALEVSPKATGCHADDCRFFEGNVTRFRVSRYWNEPTGEQIVLETAFPSGACGFEFTPGMKYLVFATRSKTGTVSASICSRTTLAATAPDLLEHVIRLAGEGQVPGKK